MRGPLASGASWDRIWGSEQDQGKCMYLRLGVGISAAILKQFFLLFEGNDSFKRSLYREQKNPPLCGLWVFSGLEVLSEEGRGHGAWHRAAATFHWPCASLVSHVGTESARVQESGGRSSLVLKHAALAFSRICDLGQGLNTVAPPLRHLLKGGQ